MKEQFERWLSLPGWERSLFMRLMLLLPIVGMCVRLFGYRSTRARLERFLHPLGKIKPYPQPLDMADRIARLVAIASRHGPYRPTCLRQSLALWWLLARRGVSSDICFGVRQDPSGVQAHAWVELNGKPLNQSPGGASDYTPLAVTVAPEGSANS